VSLRVIKCDSSPLHHSEYVEVVGKKWVIIIITKISDLSFLPLVMCVCVCVCVCFTCALFVVLNCVCMYVRCAVSVIGRLAVGSARQ